VTTGYSYGAYSRVFARIIKTTHQNDCVLIDAICHSNSSSALFFMLNIRNRNNCSCDIITLIESNSVATICSHGQQYISCRPRTRQSTSLWHEQIDNKTVTCLVLTLFSFSCLVTNLTMVGSCLWSMHTGWLGFSRSACDMAAASVFV